MRFLSLLRVQDGRRRLAPDPMVPGFDLSAFRHAFEANNDGSSEDINALRFGELIARRAESLFDELADLRKKCRRFSYDEVAEAVVNFTHQQQLVVSSEYEVALSDLGEITQEALHGLRTTRDIHGNAFTPAEILERTIDGVRHVLREACDKGHFGKGGEQPEIDSLDAVLPTVVSLGYLYESLRTQWHDVLWSGARVSVDPQPPYNYAIDRTSSHLERMASVDLDRRQVNISHGVNEHMQLDALHQIGRWPILAWDRTSSDERRLVVSTVKALPAEQRQIAKELAAIHAGQIDPNVEFFLQKSHSSLIGITYRQVLHAWYCLALLVLSEYFRAASDFDSHGHCTRPPVTCLQPEQLTSALCEVLDIQQSEAQAVVDFLTYKGKHQTLWAKPLLKTTSGLLPMWWPILSGHLMRLVAEWGKADDEGVVRFSEKGHQYEHVVYQVLDEMARKMNPAVQYIPLGPRLPVPEKATDGNDVGDVDAAFVVDRTLFILECRAVGYPAEAFEFWTTHRELESKVHQALRKKHHLTSSPAVIRAWFDRAGVAVAAPEIERVVALVVSNSFLLEGERTEEPYFVHSNTLYNVLFTAYSAFGAGSDSHGKDIELRVDFRQAGVANADAVIRALERPVKAEAYKMCTTFLDASIPPFHASDSSGMVRSPVVVLPTDARDVEGLLQRCSFADHVRRVKVA